MTAKIETNFSYIHPNIFLTMREGFKTKSTISKGEKIFEAEKLIDIISADSNSFVKTFSKLNNFVIVLKPLTKKYNVQFVDENTLIALRDLKEGERFVAYYPKRTKKRFTAPNMFVYYFIQFFVIAFLLFGVLIGCILYFRNIEKI